MFIYIKVDTKSLKLCENQGHFFVILKINLKYPTITICTHFIYLDIENKNNLKWGKCFKNKFKNGKKSLCKKTHHHSWVYIICITMSLLKANKENTLALKTVLFVIMTFWEAHITQPFPFFLALPWLNKRTNQHCRTILTAAVKTDWFN